MTTDGKPGSSTLRFNAVTDYLFEPLLARTRQAAGESPDVASSELEKFDNWSQLNYKFMMLARHSLLGGETVLQAFLQPEIRLPVFTLLGITFYRTASLTHAGILTDREIIMIREDYWYGGIQEYLPLRNVVALSLSERENGLLALCIQLSGDIQLEYLLESTAKQEIHKFLELSRGLTAK